MIVIAILDDDTEMTDLMAGLLEGNGRKIVTFTRPGKFLDSLNKGVPDFLVLDINLPGISGNDLLQVLRNNPKTSGIPVLAVSGVKRDTTDVISGLDRGADDYILKPFDNNAFQVRVETLLRRSRERETVPEPREEEITIGPLLIGLDSRTIVLQGQEVKLAPLEFDLLIYLIRQRNRVVSRGTLLENVWKGDPVMSTRAVDKRVETLRTKLRKFGSHIETIFGIGYMFRF